MLDSPESVVHTAHDRPPAGPVRIQPTIADQQRKQASNPKRPNRRVCLKQPHRTTTVPDRQGSGLSDGSLSRPCELEDGGFCTEPDRQDDRVIPVPGISMSLCRTPNVQLLCRHQATRIAAAGAPTIPPCDAPVAIPTRERCGQAIAGP